MKEFVEWKKKILKLWSKLTLKNTHLFTEHLQTRERQEFTTSQYAILVALCNS